MNNFALTRNAFGKLVLTIEGRIYEGVIPTRAFPITAPQEGLALMSADGHEALWIDCLTDLPEATRALLHEELTAREFMPELQRITHVSSFTTPSMWQVETDRGATTLTLKGEEDIRRLGDNALMIADSHGVQFLIRDLATLDKPSRKLLNRFL
ncbi:MAG: DUF1854 domain-containing protein [Pseudomonadota bacterium]